MRNAVTLMHVLDASMLCNSTPNYVMQGKHKIDRKKRGPGPSHSNNKSPVQTYCWSLIQPRRITQLNFAPNTKLNGHDALRGIAKTKILESWLELLENNKTNVVEYKHDLKRLLCACVLQEDNC